MKLSSSAAVSFAVALVLVASEVRTANAAAELSAAVPAPGSETSEAPDSLELNFTQDVEEATITLNDSELDVAVEDERVTANLDTLGEGRYTVSWVVTSEVDGRETSGSYEFEVRAAEDEEALPEVDPEARADRVEEVADDNRTEVVIWTSVGIAAAALLALIFFYFRTSIPMFGTTRIEGGLPPPGQSPPEHSEEEGHRHD